MEKITILLNKIVMHLFLFLLPIFFAFFLRTSNVFELNKVVFFKVVTLLLLPLFGLQLFSFSRPLLKRIVNSQETTWLLVLLNGVLISSLVSTHYSIAPALSSSGAYDRFMGLETIIFLIIFAVLFFFSLQTKQLKINAVLRTMLFSSLLVSLYAIFQHFGLDPLAWSESSRLRAFSTLGQPNHLGSFLLMTISLAVYFFYVSKIKLIKFFYFFVLLSSLLALYYSFSTSSWLGLIAALLLFVFYFLFITHKTSRSAFFLTRKKELVNQAKTALGKRVGWSLQKYRKGIIVFLVIIVLFVMFGSSSVAKSRIQNLFDLQTGSTAARLDFWQASLKAIKEKPWLGYGLDAQGEVLWKYYEPSWAIHSSVNVSPTRAHNIFLDVLLTRGTIGLTILILFIFFFIYLVHKNLKSKENVPLTLSIAAAFLSYFVYLNFNYTHITNQVYVVIFFTILFSLYFDTKNPCHSEREGAEPENLVLPKSLAINGLMLSFAKVIVYIFLLFIVLNQVDNQIKHLRADHYYLEMRQAAIYNQYVLAFDMYDLIKTEILEYSVYDRKFVALMNDWSKQFKGDAFYALVNSRYKEILPQIEAKNFSNLLTRAKIYSSLSKEDERYGELATRDFRNLISQSPEMPALKRELGEHFIRSGQDALAIAIFKEALEKIPPLDSEGLNLDHERAIIGEMIRNYQGIKKSYERTGGVIMAREYEEKIMNLGK